DLPHQFNSSGGTNTITRTSTGSYTVLLPGLGSRGGTVKVTAQTSASRDCKAAAWAAAGADETVDVRCFDAAGAPVDERFTLAYSDGLGIAGSTAASGDLLADRPTATSYTP